MIRNTGREERAPRFPGHRDSATGDSSYGLLRRLKAEGSTLPHWHLQELCAGSRAGGRSDHLRQCTLTP